MAGDADAAAAKYQQAIDLGERRPEAIGQGAALLIRHGRPAEAKRLLENLGDDAARARRRSRPPGDPGLAAQP